VDRRSIREPEDLLDLINEGRDPMERVSARLRACRRPSSKSELVMKHENHTDPKGRADRRPEIIAIRKTCDAEGTGLSHFVLMDKQVKR
jgi:modified peptide precursor CbpA